MAFCWKNNLAVKIWGELSIFTELPHEHSSHFIKIMLAVNLKTISAFTKKKHAAIMKGILYF